MKIPHRLQKLPIKRQKRQLDQENSRPDQRDECICVSSVMTERGQQAWAPDFQDEKRVDQIFLREIDCS